MDIEFDVKVTAPVLIDFQMQHSYKQAITIFMTAAGAVLCFLFISGKQTSPLYIVIGLIAIFLTPVQNIYNSIIKVKMIEAFQTPLHYKLSEEGIEVSQGEVSQLLEWNQVMKVTGTRKSIFVYSTKRAAFIFPRKEMDHQTEDVIRMIAAHIEPKKLKLRY